MCSINVVFRNTDKIDEMNQKTKHRGTRIKSLVKDNIGFGSVRLAIQGLNVKFDMPYKLQDDSIVLYNGEIFNFKELKPEAESDIELFEDIYYRYNPINFDGDFAYVLYNHEELTVITDRFGKRQLYYKTNEDGIITMISSEIKALIEPNDKLNIKYFQTIKKFGYNFGNNDTYIKSIYRFMPGCRYTIDQHGNIIQKYEIQWDSNILSDKKDLKELIKESIKRRLISDIPIAFLYSGGLDSSIILYHLKELKANIKILTIENSDDIEFATRYANELGFEIEKIKLDVTEHKEAVKAAELMTDLGSTIQNYQLFKKIKELGYNVVITGDACDEVFRGYKRNLKSDFIQNDIFNELVFYHFPRLDKLAMAHTVEYRSPYSSDVIIDFGLKIPYEEGKNKEFLKKIYKDIIPDYILNRKKTPLKLENIDSKREELITQLENEGI